MTKQEKLNKLNSLIEQIKEINQDRDFAVFFSAVCLDKDRMGMHQAFYTDGDFEQVNLAIGTGVSIIADQCEQEGIDRIAVLESVVNGIGHAEEMRLTQTALDEIDDDSNEGDRGTGHA